MPPATAHLDGVGVESWPTFQMTVGVGVGVGVAVTTIRIGVVVAVSGQPADSAEGVAHGPKPSAVSAFVLASVHTYEL